MYSEPIELAQKNLCGVIIIYQDYSHLPKTGNSVSHYPDSFSRSGRQKRQIANAVEWMRLNSKFKLLVFTLTIPVVSDYKTTNKNISKYFENFSRTYDCSNYVWVREYQKNLRPHYHAIADVPFFNVQRVNKYWSGLWNSDAYNSLRLNPLQNRFVKSDSRRLCWYLTKYLSKSLGEEEKGLRMRKFAISKQANIESKPETCFAYELKDVLDNYDIRKIGQGVSMAVPNYWNSNRKPKKINRELTQTVKL